MLKRIRSVLILAFYIIFTISFVYVFFNVLFLNNQYNFKPHIIIPITMCWFVITFFIYNLLGKIEDKLKKYEKSILIILFIVLLFVHGFFGYQLAIETSYDVEAIYKGAVNYMEKGDFGDYSEYYYRQQHNAGGLLYLAGLFKIVSIFNLSDYYFIGVIHNIISLNLAFLLIYLIIKKKKGIKFAFLSLWFSLAIIPLYFYIPVFYTDMLSILFPILIYYIYLQAREKEKMLTRTLYFLFIGIICTVGSLIKFTVVIVAIAILIEIIFFDNIKKNIIPMITGIATFLLLIVLYNFLIYNFVFDKEEAVHKKIPYTHWVMMGIGGNGAYNHNDFIYTFSYDDPEERKEAISKEIKNRLNNFGFFGYLKFLGNKQVYSFGSGILNVNDMIDDKPLRKSFLQEFGFGSGKYFDMFSDISHSYHIFMFLLIIISSIYNMVNFKKVKSITIQMAIYGIFVFLLIYEANSRYIINYLPIFVVCMTLISENVYNFFNRKIILLCKEG